MWISKSEYEKINENFITLQKQIDKINEDIKLKYREKVDFEHYKRKHLEKTKKLEESVYFIKQKLCNHIFKLDYYSGDVCCHICGYRKDITEKEWCDMKEEKIKEELKQIKEKRQSLNKIKD